MTPQAEAELGARFEAAVALWRRRAELLPDCDVIPDWRASLATLEAEYAEHVATLAAQAPEHPALRTAWLRGGEGPSRQVAGHVMLSARRDALWTTLITAAAARDDHARVVAGMLRFCPDDIVLTVVGRSLDHDRPGLRRAFADVTARRGLRELAPRLRVGLGDRSELPELEVVDALGLLGDVEAGDALLAWVDRLDAEGHGLWQTGCVRALSLIGDPRALELCTTLVRDERGDVDDTPARLARIGGPAAIEPMLERLAASELPIWRERIAEALGLIGSVRVVEALLAALTDDEDDIRAAADRGLRRLLGDPEEVDESHEAWSEWWQAHRDEFDPQIRHLQGRPITIEDELAWLEHPNGDDRELAIESVILATGRHIPFDPRGYVEDQRAGVARWREWAAGHAARLVPGTWWRDV